MVFAGGSQWITIKNLDFEGVDGGDGISFVNAGVAHIYLLDLTVSHFHNGWMSNPWLLATPPQDIHLGSCEFPMNIIDMHVNPSGGHGQGGYGYFSNSVMAVNYQNNGSDGVYDHNVYFSTGPRAEATENMVFECGSFTDSSVDANGVSQGIFLKLSGHHRGVIVRNNHFYGDRCNTWVLGATTSNDDGVVDEFVEAEIYNNRFDASCPRMIYGEFFRNTKIYNNIFDFRTPNGGYGYQFIQLNRIGYAANPLGNISIFNNHFVCNQNYCPDDQGASHWIELNDQGTSNKFFNNFFYTASTNVTLFGGTCGQFGANGADFNNNFVYAPNDATPGMLSCPGGSGNSASFATDPRLMSVAGGDYRPQANSPLVNSARAAGAPLFDFLGNPRDAQPDIGAFERQ